MDVIEYSSEWRRQHNERLKDHLADVHRRSVNAADAFARRFLPLLLAMRQHGLGLRDMASAMNARGYTARHGGPWTDQTVRQMLKRRHHVIISEVFDEQPQQRFVGWGRRV